MCRDNSYNAKRDIHIVRWALQQAPEYIPFYHRVSGTSEWPVILRDTVEGNNVSIFAHWGLIPFWTKTKQDGIKASNSMVNARRETIFEKPAYKNLVYKSRCILPSTGFFEHHHITRGKKDVSIPFYIKRTDDEIFGLGAIYTTWTDKTTGEMITSFSVVTQPANALMEKIHNHGDNAHRMPLILDRNMEAAWMNPNTPQGTVDQILNYSIAADKLNAWPIQSVRKRDRPDGPELWERVEVPEITWC